MKPDGTNSFSTADEKLVSPEGNHVTEPDAKTGSAIKKCHQSNGTTWSYVFVHNSKVKKMEEWLEKDKITYFVHKTVRYFKKLGKQKVQHREIPTVSGLVFFQGSPVEIQAYLDEYFLTPVCVRIVAQARWQRYPTHRCNHSCVSRKPLLSESVSCSTLIIIMLATAFYSVSPQVKWLDWKATSFVLTEIAVW